MIFLILLLSTQSQTQSSPPSSPQPLQNTSKEWWEVLLDPPVLIPVIVGTLVFTFLFIFVFRYCNKERSDGLVNVLDSIGNNAVKIRINEKKNAIIDEKTSTVFINTKKKKKEPPVINLKK